MLPNAGSSIRGIFLQLLDKS